MNPGAFADTPNAASLPHDFWLSRGFVGCERAARSRLWCSTAKKNMAICCVAFRFEKRHVNAHSRMWQQGIM